MINVLEYAGSALVAILYVGILAVLTSRKPARPKTPGAPQIDPPA